MSNFRAHLLLSSAAFLALVAHPALAQQMAANDQAIETVTVLGKAIYVAPSATPMEVSQPTSVVQEGFIQNNIVPQSSFDDIVKFEPSVYDSSPNGPGLGKSETLSLRGFQDGQYNVTFDGIPFGDTTDLHHTSSALFIAHDLAAAEVDRGPGGGATIGKATFGGTMGFRTKDPQTELSINPYATVGSFNTVAAGVEVNSGDTGIGSGFVDFQHELTDGYLTYAGEHRTNIMGKWRYDIDDSTTLTLLGTFNHEFQYTTQGATLANMAANGRNFALNNDPTTQAYYKYNPSNYYSDFYYADLKKTFGSLTLENKAYTDYFAHVYEEGKDATDTNPADNSLTTYPLPAGGPTVYLATAYPSSAGVKSKDIPGKAANARFRDWGDILNADYDLGFATLQAGTWFDSQHDNRWSGTIDLSKGGALVPGKNGTPYSYYYHNISQTWQPFAELDWKLTDQLTLTPGVKYTDFHRHVDGPINKGGAGAIDYTDNYDALQPSVSARYAIDDSWNVYAQAASGFLAPPVDVFQVSKPHSIRPEKTWNYQAGTTMQRDNFTVSLDAYYIDFTNFFASIQIPGSSDTTFVNGGGALYRGLEAEGQYVVGEGWSVYLNGSLNNAQYKGSGVDIAESPEYTASAGLLYDTRQGPYGSLIAKLVGPRWGDDGDAIDPTTQKLIAADSYRFGSVFTMDLAVGYRFGALSDNLSDFTASLKIANLLDNRQINDFGGLQSATSTPIYWAVAGRSIFFNISASVN
jgi:iron complex outermembrane receptor protein